MKSWFVPLLIGLVIGIGISYASYVGYAQLTAKPVEAAVKPPTIAEMLTLVNAERAKYGVAPLKEDTRLDASAQLKANDDIANNYFAHVSPITNTRNGLDAIKATGIACIWESENIHQADISILTSKETVDGWISSKPHHDAMIDPKYSLTGFGIKGDQIVEHFCQI